MLPLFQGECERLEIVEREPWTRENDPLGEREKAFRFTPVAQVEKAVCADDVEESVLWRAELLQQIDSVVGGAVRVWVVKTGRDEAWIFFTEKLCHGKPIFERGLWSSELEWL